jgi:O-antigen ligase
MTTLSPDILRMHKDKPLSLTLLATIGLGVLVLFVGGQLIHLPVIVFGILPLAYLAGSRIVSSGRAALYAFIGVAFALSFRVVTTKGTDVIDILAGAVLGLISLGWMVRLVLLEREGLTYSVPQLLVVLYLAWGMFVGVGGVLWWNTEVNEWIREYFIQCPLMVVPLLYIKYFKPGSHHEKLIQRFALGGAIAVVLSSIGKYAYFASHSLYAYQIGRLAAEPSAAIILLLTCVAFRLFRVVWIPTSLQLALAAMSVGLLVLSGYRTIWVAVSVVTMLLFLLTERALWGRGLKFLLALIAILGAIGSYLFFSLGIFRIFVLMTFDRLLTTTQVTTDPSLFNRYIETGIVSDLFLSSPIAGYGFGARFEMFDWLMGISYLSSYSHNGYFYVAFKSGLIGFTLLYTAYIWFMVKAIRLARDTTALARTRAIAAVASCYFACELVSNLTLNVISERNAMIWIGLFWAFILSHEIAKRRMASTQKSNGLAPGLETLPNPQFASAS